MGNYLKRLPNCQNSAIEEAEMQPNPVVKTVVNKRILMRRSPNSHLRKPIVLPHLPNLKHSALRPMNPLQPPNLSFTENRLGSPAPKSNIPLESDHDINSNNGKPIIKITHHETDASKETNEHKDFTQQLSKKKPMKITGLNAKPNDLENRFFNIHSNSQIKNLQKEPDKKLKCPPLEGTGDTNIKVVQIPNRYSPLKPIGKTMHKNEK